MLLSLSCIITWKPGLEHFFLYQHPTVIGSSTAPQQLLEIQYNYKTINASVASVAIKKMFGHLWYLAEQPVALAFFDQDTSSDTKRRMVQVVGVQGFTDIWKRTQ